MAEIPSIESIERAASSAWGTARADVLSHLYLLFVVYQTVHLTAPDTTPPRFDLGAARNSCLYEMAKDAGLLWLLPVLLLVGLFMYRALLRWIAGMLIQIQSIILYPRRPSDALPNSGKVNAGLALIAFTLRDPDFTLSDIYRQWAMLSVKYGIKKSAALSAFWDSMPTRDAYVYVGNASVFLTTWFVVNALSGKDSARITSVTVNFWLGTVLLVVFWAWAWIRWRRLLLITPAMELFCIGGLIWNDEELKGFEEWMKISLDTTVERVRKLRDDEIKSHTSRPSLLPMIFTAMGLSSRKKRDISRKRGWPARGVYERGQIFELDEKSRGTGLEWWEGYASFVYYTLHVALCVRVGGMWSRFVAFVIGPPPPR